MRTKRIDVILLIFLVSLVYIVLFQFYAPKIEPVDRLLTTVNINDNYIYASIADDNAKITKGLSDRPFLRNNQGMLFIFPDIQKRIFWMKDMNFAIDLLWINDDQVVGLENNMLPPEPETADEDLERYISPLPVDKVLEMPVGSINQFNIKIGDEVTYNF